MEVGLFKKTLKTPQELKKFYIFTGVQYKAQEIYYERLSTVTNKPIERIGEVKSIFTRPKTFIYQPKVFICRDDKEFIKSEKAWDKIDGALKDDILIFLWSEVDKRTKFYKRFEDVIVPFDEINHDTLVKYTNRNIQLNSFNTNRLIEYCEGNYGLILIEANKIKAYMEATKKSPDVAFMELTNQGAIYVPPQDVIFKYVDAVVMRDKVNAFKLLEECKKIGEPNLRLITVLYTNLKRILQVQSCESKDIAKSTGLSDWDIKLTRGKLDRWKDGELIYILEILRDLEKGIKVGTIDESITIDYLMVNIF